MNYSNEEIIRAMQSALDAMENCGRVLADEESSHIDILVDMLSCAYKGRIVELPCSVGDKVYYKPKERLCVVEGFVCNKVGRWSVHLKPVVPSWVGNAAEHWYVAFSSFNKTTLINNVTKTI